MSAHDEGRTQFDGRTVERIRVDPESACAFPACPRKPFYWYVDPKTNQPMDFVTFARGEGRFEKQFDANGIPTPAMLLANEDRRRNWRILQEMAGIEPDKKRSPQPSPGVPGEGEMRQANPA